jgi:cell division protein FtsQ
MRDRLTAPPRDLGHGPAPAARGPRRDPVMEAPPVRGRHREEAYPPRPPRAMARAAEKGNRRRALPRWAKPALSAAATLGLALVVGGGLLWTWKAGVVGAYGEELGARFVRSTAAAGFAVEEVFVEGRTATDSAIVMKALGASRGDALLRFDIQAAQARLTDLPWVLDARIERRLPNALYVRLVERKPMAIWQHDGKMTVVDAEGRELGDAAALAARGDKTLERLPQVVGVGAAEAARDLLDALSHVPVIERRVTAAVRVGRRRWDLTLDNRIVIRLPEEHMVQALHQLAELEIREGVLGRDIVSLDLRQQDRMTVRLPDPPPEPETAKKAATTAAKRM